MCCVNQNNYFVYAHASQLVDLNICHVGVTHSEYLNALCYPVRPSFSKPLSSGTKAKKMIIISSVVLQAHFTHKSKKH